MELRRKNQVKYLRIKEKNRVGKIDIKIKNNMKIVKGHKYNRRRALDCTLIKKSDTYPNYYKYEVTIGEKDGTVHKQPAYGKDMQSALSRLIKKELTVKVERKAMNNPFVIFLGWLLIMGWPIVLGMDITSSPWFIAYGFIGIFTLIVMVSWWNNYISRGQ